MKDNNQEHPSCCHRESQDFFRQLDVQLLIHELKGPLSVIENNNRMLLELPHRYGRVSAFQESALKRSLRCTAKLKNIIHSLLEVGSCGTGGLKLSRFDIVHSATEIIVDLLETESFNQIDGDHDINERDQYLSANGISLDVSPEVRGVELHQDEDKFGHILTNLVRNALQHKQSHVGVHLALKKSKLEICVDDDGPGIDPEDQPKLFTCYTQTKACHRKIRAKGHGLGLASSRILARRLGGDITIDTHCRTGSRFVLQLPLNEAEVESQHAG